MYSAKEAKAEAKFNKEFSALKKKIEEQIKKASSCGAMDITIFIGNNIENLNSYYKIYEYLTRYGYKVSSLDSYNGYIKISWE